MISLVSDRSRGSGGVFGAQTTAPAEHRRLRRAFTAIELVSGLTIIGILLGIGVPRITGARHEQKIAQAIAELRTMSAELNAMSTTPTTLGGIARSGRLDPWGRPYVYIPLTGSAGDGGVGTSRIDRFHVSVNARYDLYSVGNDGETTALLTAKVSQDDIVVAGDGAFVGLGARY